MEKICKNCKFWDSGDEGDTKACLLTKKEGINMAYTTSDMSCPRFEAKEPPAFRLDVRIEGLTDEQMQYVFEHLVYEVGEQDGKASGSFTPIEEISDEQPQESD